MPKKIHLSLNKNYSLLEFVSQRVLKVNIDWWLATTDLPTDDFTSEVGKGLGLNVFRGEQDNVLSRFLSIGQLERADWIVRVTADNPFIDSERITELIEVASGLTDGSLVIGEDLVTPQFPLGYLPEIVSLQGLEQANYEMAEDRSYHQSHVTTFLKPHSLKVFRNPALPTRPDLRWTIDTRADLEMARNIINRSISDPINLKYLDILEILRLHPYIQDLNFGIKQKGVGDL